MPRSLKCPTCNAPLELDDADQQIDVCEYCGGRILLSPGEYQQAPSYGHVGDLPHLDPGNLLAQARNLKRIKELALSGNKIEAIKLFRETFDVGLKEAKDAVERLCSGKPIVFNQVSMTTSATQFAQPAYGMYGAPPAVQQYKQRSGSTAFVAVLATIAIVVGIAIFAVVMFVTAWNRVARSIPAGFGNNGTDSRPAANDPNSPAIEVLRFGGEGIGAGKFKDNRTIAIDGDNNVYSADYTGRAVQKFDANGKFLLQWDLGSSMPILKIAADQKDRVYVLQSSALLIFDGTKGDLIRSVARTNYHDLAISTNGSLYALDYRNEVLKLDENGKQISKTGDLTKQINFAVTELQKLAVDGEGNLYAADGTGRNLLKFSPDGKFLFRFDSSGAKEGSAGFFGGLAVDNKGKGRVFAANGFKVFIYDTDGAFLGSFNAPQTFGLTVDANGAL